MALKQLICRAKVRLQNSIKVAPGAALLVDDSAKLFRNEIGIEHGHGNRIEIGEGAEVRRCKITMEGKGNRIIIAPGCQLRGLTIEALGHDCTIEIGQGVRNTGPGKISCQERGTRLVIGKGGLLAKGVTMLTSDGHDIYGQNGERINPPRDIIIEPHVWVGQDAMILKGAHIGTGCVIGARSVVTGKIAPESIAAGNPAAVIKARITWDEKLTQQQAAQRAA